MTSIQLQKVTKIEANAFKWKHFSYEIILRAVRWYCQFRLSYRDFVLIMEERGLSANHTTLMRWVPGSIYRRAFWSCCLKLEKAKGDRAAARSFFAPEPEYA